MRQSKVFLDSSVIIAGLASNTGGSNEILVLAELGVIIPYISEDVVSEVVRNIQKKLPGSIAFFITLFKKIPFKMIEFSERDLDFAKTMINEKDAPILAAAVSGKVDWLLSLDKHFITIKYKGELDFVISTPGEFLRKFTPV
jgi:putative PIN family toxin of toxin-antitoxin system